jgi:hypothetical protein
VTELKYFLGRRRALIGALAVQIIGCAASALAQTAAPSEWTVRSGGVTLNVSAAAADAALAVIQARDSSSQTEGWTRLLASRPYQRLHAREAAMGRVFTDSAFRAFLTSDSARVQAPALEATLRAWQTTDIEGAARRAAAYLPAGTPIHASLYFMIKPRLNTFVFDVQKDPTIFVAIDPSLSAAEFQNEYAHELHHIGYGVACRENTSGTKRDPRTATVLDWMGSFGEGWAMLAAAGDPRINPHSMSSAAERATWDSAYANVGVDMSHLETFFMSILNGVSSDSVATATGMSFFGPVQGPWYTVGYLMASTIERTDGHAALLAVLCDHAAMLMRYQAIAASQSLPRWSDAFVERLRAATH